MPFIRFTAHLRSKLKETEFPVGGQTVREALEEAFVRAPGLQGYLLDDQGKVRHHVAIFLDGESITDRDGLSDPLGQETEIVVMQALSGG